MRTNPPFDPRVQQMGMYVGGPPQRYLQPIIQQNIPMQPGFPQIPVINQPQPAPVYPVQPVNQNQYHPQYINEQQRGTRVEPSPAAVVPDTQKPASVPTNNKMIVNETP
jgi:hypothetical protein